MAYSNPQYQTYTFPEHDFGAGAGAVSFKGPLGKAGRLEDITVHATETFTNTTTGALVRVGTSSDADAYAEANLGATADTDTFVATQDDVDAIINDTLPADTQIEVAFVAPTGGTPAGIGTVSITVAWF